MRAVPSRHPGCNLAGACVPRGDPNVEGHNRNRQRIAILGASAKLTFSPIAAGQGHEKCWRTFAARCRRMVIWPTSRCGAYCKGLPGHSPSGPRTVVADCSISLPALSQSSSASDAREHGMLIDFSKLDRYFAVIADCTIAVESTVMPCKLPGPE